MSVAFGSPEVSPVPEPERAGPAVQQTSWSRGRTATGTKSAQKKDRPDRAKLRCQAGTGAPGSKIAYRRHAARSSLPGCGEGFGTGPRNDVRGCGQEQISAGDHRLRARLLRL